VIYFLRAEQDSGDIKAGWIKIGTTIRLSERLKQIAAEIGHSPTVLAVLDGAYAEERALHDRFSDIRQWCEWFHAGPDLLLLIATETKPWDGTDEVPLQKTTPVRLTEDAIKWARIASGYTGESVSEYLSRIAVEKGQDDAERLNSQVKASNPSKGKGELK
jgi:hypothetical protein